MDTARAAAAPALLLLAACAAPADRAPSTPEIRAVAAAAAPVLDGDPADACWAAAPETVVRLAGTGGAPRCAVRAVVAGDALHLLVSWEDGTEDRVHKPWARPAGRWVEGPEREDVLSVAFPLDGEFTADMTSPVEATWDVWQWKAGRTDPAGFAMDKIHRMSLADMGGKRGEHRLPDGRTVYMARPEDAGTSATETLPEPADEAGGPKFRARTPAGSAADVAARGAWRDGRWTVELSRRLSTGHADDADLAGREAIAVAFALLDRAEDEAHSASGPLLLRLPR